MKKEWINKDTKKGIRIYLKGKRLWEERRCRKLCIY
jgi:hypothetical protein